MLRSITGRKECIFCAEQSNKITFTETFPSRRTSNVDAVRLRSHAGDIPDIFIADENEEEEN